MDSNKHLVAKRTIIVAGAALLASLTLDEGTRYTPYRDIAGVLTVCQGHTGADIVPGKRYTKSDCDALLFKNTERHGRAVLRCTKVPLNQNQYDAFVRFTFNVGTSAYCNSGLLKKLNQGDYTSACNDLLRWDKARVNGVLRPVKGLTARRRSEREQCLTPVAPPTTSQHEVT